MALAHDPAVLLADEPVANLDPVTGCEILDLLGEINRDRVTAVLCNLHDGGLATRVGVASRSLPLLADRGGRGSHEAERPLKDGLLPDESPATIIRKIQSLRDYLASALKRDVEPVVTTDYSSTIEAMRRGQIDVGYFGSLSYVLLKQRMPGASAFAAKLEGTSPIYTAVLIAGPGSALSNPEDLKGKTVAFVAPTSTSSHLIPQRSPRRARGRPGLSVNRVKRRVLRGVKLPREVAPPAKERCALRSDRPRKLRLN
jgi:hypothetical protein